MKPPSDSATTISLNKFISRTGICSRREADAWIKAGRVTLNGIVAQTGNRVGATDEVLLDGKPLRSLPRTIYLAFHKPVGIVCTTDLRERNNIISYINYPQRLFPIGRLDKASEGLIFLTNDGDIVNKILRAGNRHEKEYIVTVDKLITPQFLKNMASGVKILGTVTKKCRVRQLGKYQFNIVLTQGLNRQIRRMCLKLGYEVTRLKRVRIMHIELKDLPKGKWREFSPAELTQLQNMVKHSSKTQDASK